MSTNKFWTIAQAKQRLSELVRAAARAPQLIRNRDRPVAAVLDYETYQEFLAWRRDRRRPTLDQRFAELRAICAEEGYAVEVPSRQDRPNPFPETLDGLPG